MTTNETTADQIQATMANLIAHAGERVEYTWPDGSQRIGRIAVDNRPDSFGNPFTRVYLWYRKAGHQITAYAGADTAATFILRPVKNPARKG